MDNLVELAKTYSTNLIEQVYFMELMKESIEELGVNQNDNN